LATLKGVIEEEAVEGEVAVEGVVVEGVVVRPSRFLIVVHSFHPLEVIAWL
jgi:hypothetical protein